MAISKVLVVDDSKTELMFMTDLKTWPHFSRGWSQSAARELGRQIRHGCNT